jgi:hypothetical protein
METLQGLWCAAYLFGLGMFVINCVWDSRFARRVGLRQRDDLLANDRGERR